MIQFLDVQKINARFETEFKIAFSEFLNKGQCILGDSLSKFESEFSAYCGTKFCSGVASGLDAIELIFKGYIELEKLKKADLAKKDPSGEVVLTENGNTLLSEMKLQPKVMKRNVIDTDGRPTFLDDLLGEL